MKTGVGSLQDGQVIEGKDLRPRQTEYPPTELIQGHIDELFASGRQLPEILEEVTRLGAQRLVQAALEAEITGFLGRYRRAVASQDARPGSRKGYREVTVKTTAGPVQLARPKLRGTTEAFASRLFGSHVTKTNALESLVIASFVRGLSVRDFEAALAEALGDQAAISKSTVSVICGQLKDEYAAWTTCTWTPPSSGCTRAPRPSRCWPPGHHHRRQARVHRPAPATGEWIKDAAAGDGTNHRRVWARRAGDCFLRALGRSCSPGTGGNRRRARPGPDRYLLPRTRTPLPGPGHPGASRGQAGESTGRRAARAASRSRLS
jgi:hypothetical protein